MYNDPLQNFTTPVQLQVIEYEAISGVNVKHYTDKGVMNVSWKSKGGTETESNGVLVVEDTAEITCWYHTEIKSECRLINLLNNGVYEILGEPENVDFRYKFMKFKVRKVKGGA